MSIQVWEHFFKPEVRASGRSLLKQGKAAVARPSDTEIIIYIRTSPPLKVSLKADSVESDTVIVDCSCPSAKKNQFCKHIWAGLLAADEKNSDFFEGKTEIEKKEFDGKALQERRPTEKSQAFEAKQAAFKEKQASYRKEQYQKQKQRQKEFKKRKTGPSEIPEFPLDVQEALQYFLQNGFDLKESLSRESVGAAKKKLARVFHPDLGGSHDETSELNNQSDILMKFIHKI